MATSESRDFYFNVTIVDEANGDKDRFHQPMPPSVVVPVIITEQQRTLCHLACGLKKRRQSPTGYFTHVLFCRIGSSRAEYFGSQENFENTALLDLFLGFLDRGIVGGTHRDLSSSNPCNYAASRSPRVATSAAAM